MKTKSKEYRLEATDYDSEDILHEENDLSTEVTPYCVLTMVEYDKDGEFQEFEFKIIQN